MKLAIMQPYFLPYIGYWQLINAVDVFVVYDNIQYTKKGWFNRNRFLLNGKETIFTVPLKKDSDYLDVKDRFISPEYNKKQLISRIQNAYAKAPYKKEILPFIEKIINCDEENLFNYIYNSILEVAQKLDINTKIIVSSSLDINHDLKSSEKVKAICKYLSADTYINAIGGTSLYDKKDFENIGVNLKFIKPKEIIYNQFGMNFVSFLSILDVLMFNSNDKVQMFLSEYDLI